MEKPRKKETYEHREVNGATEVDSRYNAGWNDHADAMSTWLEGEVVTVEDIKKILDYYDLPENGFHTDVISEAIHALITRKLTGKV